MADSPHTIGIVCGGGPAPGINSVICAATIEAINRGWKVLGIRDGFEHLTQDSSSGIEELQIADVSRIHLQGGSILSISRASLTQRDEDAEDPEWRMNNAIRCIRRHVALKTIPADQPTIQSDRIDRQSRLTLLFAIFKS